MMHTAGKGYSLYRQDLWGMTRSLTHVRELNVVGYLYITTVAEGSEIVGCGGLPDIKRIAWLTAQHTRATLPPMNQPREEGSFWIALLCLDK